MVPCSPGQRRRPHRVSDVRPSLSIANCSRRTLTTAECLQWLKGRQRRGEGTSSSPSRSEHAWFLCRASPTRFVSGDQRRQPVDVDVGGSCCCCAVESRSRARGHSPLDNYLEGCGVAVLFLVAPSDRSARPLLSATRDVDRRMPLYLGLYGQQQQQTRRRAPVPCRLRGGGRADDVA